jgi:hypothetical protein
MSIKTHHFRIPEPCHENWNDMSPTAKGRFCDSCAKEVKDFSQSTHDEIAATLLSSEDKVCGRFRKEQLALPSPKLIDLIPTRPAHAAKVAAAALAFFSCDAALSQSQAEIIDVGSVVHSTTATSEQRIRTVRGIVRDEIGEAVPFANVYFQTDLGLNRGAVTDLDGHFEIEILAEERAGNEITLTAAYLGYEKQTLTINIGEDQFVEIRLDDNEYLLMGDVIEIPAVQEEQSEIKKEFHRVKNWVAEAEESKREKLLAEAVKGDVAIIEVEEEGFLRGEPIILEEESLTKVDIISKPEENAVSPSIDVEAITETKVIKTTCRDSMVGGAIAYTISEINYPTNPVLETDTTTITGDEKINSLSEESLQLELYPNPSSDILNIKSLGSAIGKYRITDISGKLVLEGKSVKELLQIDISGLQNGNYLFIRFEEALELISTPFIVSH